MTLPEVSAFLKTKIKDRLILGRIFLFGAVAVGVFWMDTRDMHFSWGYHNDEPSKVQQIQSGERNLRHPPLMLSLTYALVQVSGSINDAQAIVEWGRLLSAFAMAMALALMADWAFVLIHPFAGLFVGLVLPFQTAFFEVGHYFKEDALFLFGIAFSLWALLFWLRHPGNRSAFVLGLALSVLAGSKYVGWILVLILLVWSQARLRLPRRSRGVLAFVFVGMVLLIYWPALVRPGVWKLFLSDEVQLLFAGDYGSGLAVPHAVYWRRLCDDLSLPLLLAGSLSYVAGSFRLGLPGLWILPFSSVVAMACLAWTAKYSDRYLLPVLLLVIAMLISGPVLFVRSFLSEQKNKPLALALLAVAGLVPSLFLLGYEWKSFRRIQADFRSDSRQELVLWMKDHLDPGRVVLAEDTLAKVHDPDYDSRIWESYFVADLGTLEELKAAGVTHLLISYDVYHRFVDGSIVTGPAAGDLFEKRRLFYRRALDEGKILWSDENRDPKALHPGLKLIELR